MDGMITQGDASLALGCVVKPLRGKEENSVLFLDKTWNCRISNSEGKPTSHLAGLLPFPSTFDIPCSIFEIENESGSKERRKNAKPLVPAFLISLEAHNLRRIALTSSEC
jgi:hypothetical protein